MSNIKVEMLSISDFSHICRTCSAETQLQSLFDNIEILSMLESFTQMQFSKTDELPDKICATCLSKIHECFHFINNCKIVDEGFRKCLHDTQKQLEQKASELHSSIEIKEEEQEEGDQVEEVVENESNTNESEYYILEWGGENGQQQQVEKHFNNSIEQETIRRINAANRMRRLRIRQFDEPPPDNTSTSSKIRKRIRALDLLEPAEQETSHRARAKLTLPPNATHVIREINERKYDTQEIINYRRAIAREQMRKLRSKITAAEVAEHRAEASERMRKVRARFQTLDLELQKEVGVREMMVPLRLSEMAQTLLDMDNKKPQVDDVEGAEEEGVASKFSLKPTKIPHVRKQKFERNIRADHVVQFRSWRRQSEAQDAATIRLAQVKCTAKDTAHAQMIEESALRRAKAAGQLKQYRPMYRKNKTIPVPIGHNP